MFFSAIFALSREEEGVDIGSALPLLTSASLFVIVLYICGTQEYQPHWLSELANLETHPSGGSLKSWGPICVVQTLHSSGRSWELEVFSRL